MKSPYGRINISAMPDDDDRSRGFERPVPCFRPIPDSTHEQISEREAHHESHRKSKGITGITETIMLRAPIRLYENNLSFQKLSRFFGRSAI